MKEITMDRLLIGHEYYDENGWMFRFTGFVNIPIQVRHGGMVYSVVGREYYYTFHYESGLEVNETLDPRKVFFEEEIKVFKFGKSGKI